MWYCVYNFINTAIFIFILPLLIIKLRKGIGERLGFLRIPKRSVFEGGSIWIHATSVGEVRATEKLVAYIREYFDAPIILSTITATGNKIAHTQFGNKVFVIYLPFDLFFIVRKIIHLVRPKLLILIETELWPNLIAEVNRMGGKVILISGRISNKRWSLFFRPFMRNVLKNLDLMSMQSEEDALRIIALGASKQKVTIGGNIKFDSLITNITKISPPKNFSSSADLFVIGSTRKGEEGPIVDAYLKIKERFPQMSLVIAPRHPERVGEVIQLIQKRGLVCHRRTKVDALSRGEVLILDTIGELLNFYSIAEITFVGGTLVPIGGHNLIEPAALDKVVFFGPFVDNYKEIAMLLISVGLGIKISNSNELAEAIIALLSAPNRLKERVGYNQKIITRLQGSSLKNFMLIKELFSWIVFCGFCIRYIPLLSVH